MRIAIFLLAAMTVLTGAARAEAPAEPSGFRMENYRSPVPATIAGGQVVDTGAARKLWTDKTAVFIDVLPRAPRPANLPADTVWRDKPRRDIPGSIWLPDTGYGLLPEPMLAYFTENLAKASGGDKTRALVFYCQHDCWMSWNAAKRAISLGYSHVLWYAAGTDGWSDEGLPTEDRTPEPRN